MCHICSYCFHPFEHINMMSKTPIFFEDLELANFSFNTSRFRIVSFQKGVTLPITDYIGLLRNNSIIPFLQHQDNWLISPPHPTTSVHSRGVSCMPSLVIGWCLIFGCDFPVRRLWVNDDFCQCPDAAVFCGESLAWLKGDVFCILYQVCLWAHCSRSIF